jgi:serine/threonine-protein kinase
MPSPNPNDPSSTVDPATSPAAPGKDVTTDDAPGTSVPDGRTDPYVPGSATEPGGAAPERAAGAFSVPGYEIGCVLGHGGMGVVFKATQVRADRIVALKVIKANFADDDDLRGRFRTEAQALARIKHANIVQIYDVGEESGCPYFSMEFVSGGSLAERLQRETLPVQEAARLIETLARAVEAAHQAGVLHRDLKPSNVLLDSDGTPRITDFGLAKQLEKDDSHTRTGAVLGTPAYMAPEQASGQLARIGKATDVYGLGATLYELLTGRPPFRADHSAATVQLVLTAEPTPPSRSRSGIPLELEAICLKCLEKDPDSRYPSAAALADDLGRFLRGESTVARPLRWRGKLWRALRRRRAAVAVVVLVLAAVVVTGVIVNLLRPAGGTTVGGEPDPDAALKEIQKDLAAGKAVTLVGKTGPPRWFRSVHGGGAVTEPALNDGTFAIQSLDEAFVELLDDPTVERYRFSAEVRHDRPDMAQVGKVGVYFGRHAYETGSPYKPFQVLRLEFADENIFQGGPLPPTGRLGLWACLSVAPPGRTEEVPAVGAGSHDFSPAKRFPGPWRKLVVEVRPDRILPSWWDEKTKKLAPMGQGLNAEGLKSVTNSLQQQADKLKDVPSAPRTIEPIQPRSGLGLFAFRSKASFRNVVIEPLPPDQ